MERHSDHEPLHRFINCVHYYVLRGRFLGVLGEIETSLNCYDI